MSLSTCDNCGGHIPLGPKATNRCEKCGTHAMGKLRYVSALCCVTHREINVNECPICLREERDRLRQEVKAREDERKAAYYQAYEDFWTIHNLSEERDRLRDLISQAWDAGEEFLKDNICNPTYMVGSPSKEKWLKQKGLV